MSTELGTEEVVAGKGLSVEEVNLAFALKLTNRLDILLSRGLLSFFTANTTDVSEVTMRIPSLAGWSYDRVVLSKHTKRPRVGYVTYGYKLVMFQVNGDAYGWFSPLEIGHGQYQSEPERNLFLKFEQLHRRCTEQGNHHVIIEDGVMYRISQQNRFLENMDSLIRD